jgi:hypothetical protein
MGLFKQMELKKIFNQNKLWKNKNGIKIIEKETIEYLNAILSNARIIQDSWDSSKPNFRVFKPESLEKAKEQYIQKQAEKVIKDYISLVAERMKKGVDDFGTTTN